MSFDLGIMQNYKDFAYLQGFRHIFLTEFYFGNNIAVVQKANSSAMVSFWGTKDPAQGRPLFVRTRDIARKRNSTWQNLTYNVLSRIIIGLTKKYHRLDKKLSHLW